MKLKSQFFLSLILFIISQSNFSQNIRLNITVISKDTICVDVNIKSVKAIQFPVNEDIGAFNSEFTFIEYVLQKKEAGVYKNYFHQMPGSVDYLPD